MSNVDLQGVEPLEGGFCWNCTVAVDLNQMELWAFQPHHKFAWTVRIQESSDQLKSHGGGFLHCILYWPCEALCYS